MTSSSRRTTTGLAVLCAFFAVMLLGVGAAGILGVRHDNAVVRDFTADELATSATTALVDRTIDQAYSAGSAVVTAAPQRRAALASTLYDERIPAVEAAVEKLRALHSGDAADERAGIAVFVDKWHRLRAVLNALPDHGRTEPGSAEATGLSLRLEQAYAPLTEQLGDLSDREVRDARDAQTDATGVSHSTIWTIVLSVLAALLAIAMLAAVVLRRVRRAADPAEEQAQFADTLQLARDEEEAHLLLQRHLQRAVDGSRTTVLNRNNSADRLEAKTSLDPDSALNETLQHAEPGSCLAVRSGRVNQAGPDDQALLGCAVCSTCPGSTLCTPLTVGGEVIGSVLLTGPDSFSETDERRIRDSVAQAAPVLANLRNLAIAETRASTDSLTGLPNKRSIEQTMKQLVAHASRYDSPMSVLLLDLDHFKEINDRLGHPVGDTVLANVGAALAATMRESDTAGRSGGEEFMVLLPGTARDAAVLVAERIRAAVSSIEVPGEDRQVTASVGIASFPEHATNPDRLVRLADAALYLAKRTGRNRTEVALADRETRAPAGPGRLLVVPHDVAP